MVFGYGNPGGTTGAGLRVPTSFEERPAGTASFFWPTAPAASRERAVGHQFYEPGSASARRTRATSKPAKAWWVEVEKLFVSQCQPYLHESPHSGTMTSRNGTGALSACHIARPYAITLAVGVEWRPWSAFAITTPEFVSFAAAFATWRASVGSPSCVRPASSTAERKRSRRHHQRRDL